MEVSKTSARKGVRVRVPLPALAETVIPLAHRQWVHAVKTRQLALALLDLGLTRRDVCRILDVGYSSTYRWERRIQPSSKCAGFIPCFRCDSTAPPAESAYL